MADVFVGLILLTCAVAAIILLACAVALAIIMVRTWQIPGKHADILRRGEQ